MSPSSLWRRIRFLVGRSRELDGLDEEMQLHLELRERQLREQGLAPAEAARRARVQFGNRLNLREHSQDAWGWSWFDGLLGDLRHATRLLRAKPLFAAVVALTLALGIGPNVAMFSVMNAVFLRELPVREPNQLVHLRTTGQPNGMSNTGDSRKTFSYDVYMQLRERRELLSELIAYVPLGISKTPVRHGTAPEEASVTMVSGNYFTGLGVGATCGRLLTRDDETARAPVAVLSHAYLSSRFGGDCAIVGQTISVKGFPFVVVGVAAPGFIGENRAATTQLWVPLQDRAELNAWGIRDENFTRTPNWWCLMLMARLAPGMSEATALAPLQAAFINAAYNHVGQPRRGEEVPTLSFLTTSGIPGLRDAYEDPLVLLFGMVALVLVIACGNVALLLVARNSTRQREFALRLALGGGRAQLLRQLLTESALLVAAGAGLGWLFARGATEALGAWAEVDVAPDLRVLLFTLGVSALATVLFGLAPLRGATSAPMNAGLRTTTSVGLHERAWMRRTVVALQVGLCLVLLVGAGLLVRTLRNLEHIPLGMRTAGLLVFGISPQHRVRSHGATVQFYQTLLDRLRALPGVEAATVMENRLGSGWSSNRGGGVLVDGRNPRPAGDARLRWNAIGPDYFRTLGTPVLHGRELRVSDGRDAPRVAVVNQTFAREYLPNGSALGHSLAMDGPGSTSYEIVGVAADSKYTGVREEALPMAYFSYQQMGHVSAMHVELRTTGDAAAFLPVVQRVVRELAPDLPVEQPKTQEQQFANNLAEDRLIARLASVFGLLALVLLASGLYGTLAYAVARRTAEIGVRMALGAQRGHVLWMVLREALIVCAVGIAIGLPLALGGARILRSVLYGVSPSDPMTVALALAGLIVVAFVASLLPARRATSVHPMVALRAE